jgi:hypothetical protein
MREIYEVAGIKIRREAPFSLKIQSETEDFISSGKEDIKIQFLPVTELPKIPEGGHWHDDWYFIESEEEDCVFMCAYRGQPPYACVRWKHGKENRIQCEYIEEMETSLNYSHNFWDMIGLERLLLKNQAILLHSSLIRWKGQGIVFSAPSGTGKSTQANLWKQYENADILNGDRAGIRNENGRWVSYGLPYAGTSGIYRNENADLRAIIVLKQAKENRIQKLHPAEAFRYLYPEVSIHEWDKNFVQEVAELLLKLILEVPVYLFECLPNQEAVEVVKGELERGNQDGYDTGGAENH